MQLQLPTATALIKRADFKCGGVSTLAPQRAANPSRLRRRLWLSFGLGGKAVQFVHAKDAIPQPLKRTGNTKRQVRENFVTPANRGQATTYPQRFTENTGKSTLQHT